MDGTPHASPNATRRLVLALLVVLAVALGTTTTALADDAAHPAPQDRWPVGGAALSVASDLAAAHWGRTPCHGRVAVSWTHLPGALNAQSAWAYVDGDPYARPAANSDCSIELSVDADWDWPKLCTVIVHEVGHLDGHDHATDIADVMAPNYAAPVAECAATDEPPPDGEVLSSYLAAPVPPPARAAAQAKAKPRPKKAPRRKAARRPHSS